MVVRRTMHALGRVARCRLGRPVVAGRAAGPLQRHLKLLEQRLRHYEAHPEAMESFRRDLMRLEGNALPAAEAAVLAHLRRGERVTYTVGVTAEGVPLHRTLRRGRGAARPADDGHSALVALQNLCAALRQGRGAPAGEADVAALIDALERWRALYFRRAPSRLPQSPAATGGADCGAMGP